MRIADQALVSIGHSKHIAGSPTNLEEESLASVSNLVNKTIDRSCNFKKLVHGKVVLIKPNLVRPGLTGLHITTDLRVIYAVAQKACKNGAKRVILGEQPGYKVSSRRAFNDSGAQKIVDRLDIEANFFDEEEKMQVEVPKATVFKKIVVPKILMECDAFINLPKAKTHMQALVSLGIKNLHGLTFDDQRLYCHHNDLSYKLVDILRVRKPSLTVADAIWPLEGQGPLLGHNIEGFNTIISGLDVVAVDAVTASLMGVDPSEVEAIRIANSEGLGCGELSKIKVVGATPKTIRRSFRRACMSSMGAFPNVISLEAGACMGCLSSVRHSLDRLLFEKKLQDLQKSVTVYSGCLHQKRDDPLDDENWLLGDCACQAAEKNGANYLNKAHLVRGCPPHVFDLYRAMTAPEGITRKGANK
jgi:uncharacterized protein (DUF362 family)